MILVLFSFNDSNILAFPLEGFTTKWYAEALTDPVLRKALANSFQVAFVVAPLCLVLGTLAAFGLTRFRFRGRGVIGGLVGAPLVLPWLIIGIAALMGYARADIDLSLKTVVATQTVCTFPLVTAIVAAQLFRFQKVQEEAAIDLGCSRLQVLRHIILPHIGPALAAAAIFAFAWSFNNYEISAFVLGFQQTFPVWVYSNVRNPDHTAIVNAISAADLGRTGRADLVRAEADAHAQRRPGDDRADRRHRGGRGGGEDLRWRAAGDALGVGSGDAPTTPAALGGALDGPAGRAARSASCSRPSPC